MRTEFRFAAFGGQGMILAGVILGEAAIAEGKNAVQSQSYGPESRGGAAKSEVIISDEEIDYPMVIETDCLVALSQPGYDKYVSDLTPNSTVIIDEDLVSPPEQSPAKTFFRIPFARTADTLGNRIVANVVMLGSVCALTEVVTRKNLEEAIKSNVPQKYLELNIKAFNEGYHLGRQALTDK